MGGVMLKVPDVRKQTSQLSLCKIKLTVLSVLMKIQVQSSVSVSSEQVTKLEI